METISVEKAIEADPKIDSNDLLKALVAAVRWKASYSEDYKDDEKHLTIISQMMERLLERK
jgi:tellurite resistance protein